MPLVEAQDPAGPRALRPVLGLPPSLLRKDLGMSPWWLLLIIPAAGALGAVGLAVYIAIKISRSDSR